MPPLDGDSLLYHLPMTAALVQDHSMWFTRAILYPGAVELGEALGAATVGSVNGIVVFQTLQVLTLMFAAFAWARKVGGSIDAAAASAVMAAALPLVIDQTGTSQNDIFVCTMLIATCALWSQAPRLAALAIGLAVAAKLTSLILIPAVAIVMLASEGWTFSIVDVLCGVAIAVPWYLRTWLLTPSPIYSYANKGWHSTIAAHFAAASPYIIPTLRIYGGLAGLIGIIAVVYIAATGTSRPRFARTLPWLCILVFLAWIVLPNTAEDVPGTLGQIREGWSIRYAIFLLFVLATSVPIALDKIRPLPLAAFVALVASASAIVRSANETASTEAIGFLYAVPLVLCSIFLFAWLRSLERVRKNFAGVASLVLAIGVLSITGVIGARSMTKFWNAAYLQWSTRIPVNDVALDPQVGTSSKVAVLGMRAFPLVGPAFERRTYEDIVVSSSTPWVERLRKSGVSLLVAADESGSVYSIGFMKPLPEEKAIAAEPDVCLLSRRAGARVYGLDSAVCALLR